MCNGNNVWLPWIFYLGKIHKNSENLAIEDGWNNCVYLTLLNQNAHLKLLFLINIMWRSKKSSNITHKFAKKHRKKTISLFDVSSCGTGCRKLRYSNIDHNMLVIVCEIDILIVDLETSTTKKILLVFDITPETYQILYLDKCKLYTTTKQDNKTK